MERCACAGEPPVKLSTTLLCMNCGGEVAIGPPEDLAKWRELAEGSEAGKREVRGRQLRREIDAIRRCYLWMDVEGDLCPDCGEAFERYPFGVRPQFVCERCGIAAPAPAGPDISW